MVDFAGSVFVVTVLSAVVTLSVCAIAVAESTGVTVVVVVVSGLAISVFWVVMVPVSCFFHKR
ncbi:hypothetical protein LDL59_07300 [Kaistella anthropi]|nr:hypothetical protein [Kaistella anthropi]